jgi:hypothetical protein
MQYLISQIQSLYDQLNPFSTGNIILYYAWLMIYSATLVATWRAQRSATRLLAFLLNQVMQIGVFLSWSLTIVLAATFWLPSLLLSIAVIGTTFYVLRER